MGAGSLCGGSGGPTGHGKPWVTCMDSHLALSGHLGVSWDSPESREPPRWSYGVAGPH